MGCFLPEKVMGARWEVRKEGSSVLEGTRGVVKTPEMGGDDEEGVEMRVGDNKGSVFQWMDRCKRNACR